MMPPLRALVLAAMPIPVGVAACAIDTSDPPRAVPEAGAVDAPSDAVTDVVTDTSDGGGGPATCALTVSYGSKACNACVSTTCCGPIASCEANAGCKALSDCFHGCMDEPDGPGCVKDCRMKHPDADGSWAKVEACWYGPTTCLQECA